MGRGVRGCYAAQLGDCSGPLNREHFVSKNLLKEFEEFGRLNVVGYPHGNDAGQLLLSVESMSAKVLCESHNSRLSDVDVEGGRFISTFFAAHSGLLDETYRGDQSLEFNGLLIERWMLKYMCGLVASGQAGFGAERLERAAPPVEFLEVLFGLETLPPDWGLYTRPTTPVGFAQEKQLAIGLYLPLQPSGTRQVAGVKMEHYGFTSILALKTPTQPLSGTDLEGATHHPGFFRFEYGPTESRVTIVVNWPDAKVADGFSIDLRKGGPPF